MIRKAQRNEEWQLHPETGRVSIAELMGASLVDDRSNQNVDLADDVADARRHLAASVPNEGSLVRRNERPRVRNAQSTARLDRFGRNPDQRAAHAYRNMSARRRKALGIVAEPTTAAERLAATIAAYGVESPEPRPDMFGPNVRPTTGPAADLVGRPIVTVDIGAHCDTRILYDAATDTWSRERLSGDVEGFQQWVPDGWTSDDGREWHRPDNIAEVMPVTPMDDVYVPEARRVNRDLVRMANALLAGTDEATLYMP